MEPQFSDRIHYTQVARFYMWGTSDRRLDCGTIVTHTANTHVIPASVRHRRAAASVRKGDDVRLQGWLVDVDGIDDGSFHWKTSVSRSDEGPDGRETVYLTSLTVNTPTISAPSPGGIRGRPRMFSLPESRLGVLLIVTSWVGRQE